MSNKDLLKKYNEQCDDTNQAANSICCCGIDDFCDGCCDGCCCSCDGCDAFCLGAQHGCCLGICDCCTDF